MPVCLSACLLTCYCLCPATLFNTTPYQPHYNITCHTIQPYYLHWATLDWIVWDWAGLGWAG